jgi:predicted  nucleic acid-binding Zn-ribbon protein
MNLHCPACGERFEDDGDRAWTDHCWECGWRTSYRAKRDAENDAKLKALRERNLARKCATAHTAHP